MNVVLVVWLVATVSPGWSRQWQAWLPIAFMCVLAVLNYSRWIRGRRYNELLRVFRDRPVPTRVRTVRLGWLYLIFSYGSNILFAVTMNAIS